VGVIDSTLKFAHQIDLKKLVAYTTVQEMNMILLVMFIGLNLYLPLVLVFIITHTILSSIFFYIVDVIYKHHLSRTTLSVQGILQLNFIFGSFLLISVFLYLGFPYTIKFFIEIKLFLLMYNYNKIIFYFIIFIVNWFGSVIFGKIWFKVIFLIPTNKGFYILNKKEYIYFIFFIVVFLIFTFLYLYI
jgi:hydrogenase-4 component F